MRGEDGCGGGALFDLVFGNDRHQTVDIDLNIGIFPIDASVLCVGGGVSVEAVVILPAVGHAVVVAVGGCRQGIQHGPSPHMLLGVDNSFNTAVAPGHEGSCACSHIVDDPPVDRIPDQGGSGIVEDPLVGLFGSVGGDFPEVEGSRQTHGFPVGLGDDSVLVVELVVDPVGPVVIGRPCRGGKGVPFDEEFSP